MALYPDEIVIIDEMGNRAVTIPIAQASILYVSPDAGIEVRSGADKYNIRIDYGLWFGYVKTVRRYEEWRRVLARWAGRISSRTAIRS